MWVTYRVARGADGDQALSLAEDGVLDGLSVYADFAGGEVIPDPDNPGVWLVTRCGWPETSLTPHPAFDDARVASVAASLTDGGPMQISPAPPESAPAPAGATLTAPAPAPDPAPAPTPTPTPTPTPAPDLAAAFAAFLQAGQGAGGVAHAGQPFGLPPGPTVVDPTAAGMPTASAMVTEPSPYRFSAAGNLMAGTHDFSSDLFAASHGDRAAEARATTFIGEQFDVDITDTAGLNPNRQRADMYVDQREYRYPVWNAIDKGSLADSTPFVFPKFSSSSGLVAAHVEGVEPTPGTFVATTQTVTPSATSGKVEITRETWDRGGNPQVSNLIFNQMKRAWFEALEAAAIAVLDAATPTAIAITAGGGTTGQTAAAELLAAWASLQYIRGGFSMDTAFAQIDLYKVLAGARDADGAYLFPMLGPSNRDGQSRVRFGAIDVGGVTMFPAWALAATGSAVASSYLFDREVVHGWATAPQRLEFQYRVAYVDLAIWGYKATAISDITGVREITYDPVP